MTAETTETAPIPPKPALVTTKGFLEPIDRVSEVLFGLIMVLTFTVTFSVAEAGRADVQEMLIGALGCNVAWGLIDAVFYLMAVLADKGRNLRRLHRVRQTTDPEEAHRLLAAVMPPVVAEALEPAVYASLHERMKQLPEPPRRAGFSKEDWIGAGGIFLLVFVSTLPVVLPFVFMHDIAPALRTSNVIGITMLAISGAAFGRITNRNPWLVAIAMVVFGGALVALTIALGG
jgi:VIT1/CCC1 family predicted Fe2+/Mn2+ transporter